MTPVGNVVMLGVPVLPTECVTDKEFVTVMLLVIGVEGLDDCERVLTLVDVCDTDTRPDCDCLGLNETVVEDEGDRVTFVDGV